MTPLPARREADPGGVDVARRLLAWYDRHHRALPWRTGPRDIAAGVQPDPYRVWLSEIMLQQTTVTAVKPYFEAFTARWPDVAALAEAPVEDVMKAWAGLGYYSRARNLKACAEAVVARHGGRFPDDVAALKALPGIGDYTAAAVGSIAFGLPAVVMDGNVERVVTRLRAIATPLPAAKTDIRAFLETVLPSDRPGDFAQAMMDLGATICTPRRPACALCPVHDDCRARREGNPEHYPQKAAKGDKPKRVGAAFVAERGDGAVLLRRRPARGLLGGMSEPPTSDWSSRRDGGGIEAAPFAAPWAPAGTVTHIFTHFELTLTVFHARAETAAPPDWWWSPREAIGGEALPSVMKKVIEAAIPGAAAGHKHHRPPARTAGEGKT